MQTIELFYSWKLKTLPQSTQSKTQEVLVPFLYAIYKYCFQKDTIIRLTL